MLIFFSFFVFVDYVNQRQIKLGSNFPMHSSRPSSAQIWHKTCEMHLIKFDHLHDVVVVVVRPRLLFLLPH